MMFMAYGVGQIIAPQFFISSESPSYPTGFRAFYVTVALMIVIQLVMMCVLPQLLQQTDDASCR